MKELYRFMFLVCILVGAFALWFDGIEHFGIALLVMAIICDRQTD